MNKQLSYFFCGIGGSGMLPLALIMRALGHKVAGSDRSRDQNRTPEKFAYIEGQGITLAPQDGTGLVSPDQILVCSSAVEDTVPDVQAAKRLGCKIILRADLLAQQIENAAHSIAVGGTSGKSTTTGMIGWVLKEAGKNPTVINGAVMKNFVSGDSPLASALIGDPDLLAAEVDESDGSIALHHPKIAVLNNIAVDHKTIEELRSLFAEFVGKAEHAVLNLDNDETAALVKDLPAGKAVTYSLENPAADLLATSLQFTTSGPTFDVVYKGQTVPVVLHVPGHHNVSNALAAMAAALLAGVDLKTSAEALERFNGIRRRLEVIGSAGGVTVIDDFAHNPDKIRASMRTLHQFEGRVLAMFQPHGFGPIKKMRRELAECFISHLREDDVLVMPDPVYYGGTADRSVGSEALIGDIKAGGRNALWLAERDACADKLVELARPGDRIVIMGARDDSLPQFARDILQRVGAKAAA